MVASLVGKDECKPGCPNLAMANQPTEHANAFHSSVGKGLSIGKLDSEIPVICDLPEGCLESAQEALSPPARPRGIDRPEQAPRYGRVEQGHVGLRWQQVSTRANGGPRLSRTRPPDRGWVTADRNRPKPLFYRHPSTITPVIVPVIVRVTGWLLDPPHPRP